MDKELLSIAERACARAKERGASASAAAVSTTRSTKVMVRDGKLEELKAATSRGLSLRVFVDGRYGSHRTSDLSPEGLGRFVDEAVEMTRFLMPDKHRALPDPALYQGRSKKDLGIFDPAHEQLTTEARKARAMAAYQAARDAGGEKVISAEAGTSDRVRRWVLVNSNGFVDGESSTQFSQWAELSVRDPSGRRPSDWVESMSRTVAGLAPPEQTGKEAARRTLAQVGADKIASLSLPLIVENRAVSRVLGGLLAPLYGSALDQKRSCFEGFEGKPVASKLFSVRDEPLLQGGWGSRRFDGEGITARPRPLFEGGVLKSFFIDTYYGKKLGRDPTSGGSSNLVFATGERSLEQLCRAAGKAVLISRFIGGNSNSTTGDFSHGIAGFLVEGGKISRPLASMNIAGNHKEFWKGVVELGNDPYPHSSQLTPSLLLQATLVSGK